MSGVLANRVAGATPAEADQWEADALAAIDGVATPEAAEALLARIKLAEQAIRLSELGREYEQRWGRIRMLGERRYGELLGPPEPQPRDDAGRVTGSHTEASERKARERARAVAAVPEPVFNDYVENEPQPTRAGLLRTRGQLANQAGGTDEWSTPQDFFDVLDAEFKFDLDVCALPVSAKCERYFGPEDDGLVQDWTGTCWMNPPYGDEIRRWVEKAHDAGHCGATVVCLVPARVDTGWWWDFCRYGEIRFIRGRLKFGDSDTSAPFPSAVVIFGRGQSIDHWEWR